MIPAQRTRISRAALGLVALATVACGGSSSSSLSSPVAPSAPSVSTVPVGPTTGATITGQVSGIAIAAASEPLAIDSGRFQTMDSRDVVVSVVGTGISTTADRSGQFTLTNVPTGSVQLAITGGGANATVTVSGIGPNDRVQINLSVTGNSARIDSEHHSAPDNKGELAGRITSIDLAGTSFNVSSTTVKLQPTTTIRHGNTTLKLADLKIGNQVEVRGTRVGTVLTATEVKVEDGDSSEDNRNSSTKVELKGAVSAVGGACPLATFTLQGLKIATTATTTYEGGTCASLAGVPAPVVELSGTKNPDGSVTATKIAFQTSSSNVVELKGTTSGTTATSACPVLSFTVQSTKVTTSLATAYDHVTCATLKDGLKVEVKGTKLADGSVSATKVSVDD